MPIQYDEAVMLLNLHANGPLSALTTYADGTNNHPLIGLILGILLKSGITSVFLLRAPSLIAAAFFLHAVHQLSFRLSSLLRTSLIIAVVSTPLFFDYLIMARGYSLGITLLLYGWTSDKPIRSGILYGLAVCSVPTFALDVFILWLTKRNWKTLAIATTLSIATYSLIFTNVIKTIVLASSDSSEFLQFVHALNAAPFMGWLVLVLGIVAIYRARTNYVLTLPAIGSLPFLFLGYPRGHLLAALLLILLIGYAVPKRWGMAMTIFFAISATFLPLNRIASEPNMWPVTGYSVARQLTSCLSVQKRGAFIAPAEFYWKIQKTVGPLSSACPNFLMLDESFPMPNYLRQNADLLSPYGVGMYRRDDLDKLGEQLKKFIN